MMKQCFLIVSAVLILINVAGCHTFRDTGAEMSEREDILILQENLTRIQGRIEGLEIEYQRVLSEIDKMRSIASSSREQDGAMQKRMDELESRVQALDAARAKERQMIMNELSDKIADLLSKSGMSTSAASGSMTGYEHVVKDGETLSTIASAYQVKASAIIKANNLKDPDLLRKGQVLFIPK